MPVSTERHVYTCPCGRRAVAIAAGSTDLAWDVWTEFAKEHALVCDAAERPWNRVDMNDPRDDGGA